jgi:cytochrome c-type biogenesis protein CcmH/NrfG
VVLGGIRGIPKSYILWMQLGTNLALHDGDQMSPPALAAFRQAIRLAPNHPAPPYYMGLAYVRAGDLAAARPLWRRAIALSAPGSDYRAEFARQLIVLDRVLAMRQETPAGR